MVAMAERDGGDAAERTPDPEFKDHFTDDELLAANAGTEWGELKSLHPFSRGQVAVERVGDQRYLSLITFNDDDTAKTARGFVYSRTGEGLSADGVVRSLTSPAYVLNKRREDASPKAVQRRAHATRDRRPCAGFRSADRRIAPTGQRADAERLHARASTWINTIESSR